MTSSAKQLALDLALYLAAAAAVAVGYECAYGAETTTPPAGGIEWKMQNANCKLQIANCGCVAGGCCPWGQPPQYAPAVPARPLPCRCRVQAADGSTGSGTLIDGGGARYVLTCAHVFSDCRSGIVCTFPDGRRFGGTLLDIDFTSDLAAVAVAETGIAPATVDPSTPQGELAAGGFDGTGQFAAAHGSIVNWERPQGADYPAAVMTGGVRPGDSGGGVVNQQRILVGVLWGCPRAGGFTYFTCGRPLANFLARIRARFGGMTTAPAPSNEPAAPQQPVATTPAAVPPAAVPPAAMPPACNCGAQFAALEAEIGSLRTQLAKTPPTDTSQFVSQQTFNETVAQLRTEMPTYDTIAAEVQKRLDPIFLRIQDSRGASYSTDYLPARLGKHVSLPFGPAP